MIYVTMKKVGKREVEVVNLVWDLLKLKNSIIHETEVKGEKREVWKWLANKDNAMEAKDVDENSQGQPVKDHGMAKSQQKESTKT